MKIFRRSVTSKSEAYILFDGNTHIFFDEFHHNSDGEYINLIEDGYVRVLLHGEKVGEFLAAFDKLIQSGVSNENA